jgi:hypothetical protein
MSDWIIRDWAGNDIEDGFANFGDGIERVTELATIEADNNFNRDLEEDKWEELFEGVSGDLYVLNVDDNGKELPNEGQYNI